MTTSVATADEAATDTNSESTVRFELKLTPAEWADLTRRSGLATAESGERVSMTDVIRRALWPDGPPK